MLKVLRAGLAATILAMVTTVGVVANAGPAQAVTPDPLAVRTVEGIAKSFGPKVAAKYATSAGLCGTGVGCPVGVAVGIGLLAWDLYEYRDIWLPWVQGVLGESSENQTSGNVGYVNPMPEWEAVSVSSSSSGFGIYTLMTYTAAMGNTMQTTLNWTCLKPDGTHVPQSATKGWAVPNVGTTVPRTDTLGYGTACATLPVGTKLGSLHINNCVSATRCGGTFDWERALPPSTVTATTRCQRPDGSTYTITRTTENPDGQIRVSGCENGDKPIQLDTTGTNASGSTVPQWTIPLNNQIDPDHDEDYPLCAAAGCGYRLAVDGKFCVAGIMECTHWTYVRSLNASRVQCFYGTYSVATDNCDFMERAYDLAAGANRVTDKNVDGNHLTWDLPDRSPAWSTDPGSNPNPEPDPNPSPSASSTPPYSGPGTGTSTRPDLSTVCATTYNLGNVQPEAVALANSVGKSFGVQTIYGYRENDSIGEHSSGLALDFMTYSDSDKGQRIADYLKINAKALGVRWVIWEQRVWNVERASEGWRLMEDRGSPTQNHMDHVHVFLYDTDNLDLSCSGDPISGGAGGECFPNGWTWNPIQWVLQPVRCAIKWAFVPDALAVQTDLDELRDAWNGHPPGSLIETVRPVLMGLGEGWDSGCLMPNFSPLDSEELRIPCEPPAGNVWTTLYLSTQGFLVITTGIYLWGMVAAGVNAKATGA